jgi:NlpC/P60 family putative phage cell wall peptidase
MFDWFKALRGPRVERKLLAWHALGRPAWSARDPGAFAREGYAKNAIAYRCVRLIAEAAASAPGDVLLFRMHAQAPVKHAAILAEDARIIHAYWGRAVVESRFAPWWRARLAAAFAFPGALPWPS